MKCTNQRLLGEMLVKPENVHLLQNESATYPGDVKNIIMMTMNNTL